MEPCVKNVALCLTMRVGMSAIAITGDLAELA